tara:strand:- start:7543 stop:7725 length:183 start_codon:yes stop_codon:yes gene_type:complete
MDAQQYTSDFFSIFEKHVETNEHPMSEVFFKDFSHISGFNDINGKTYKEYLQKWNRDRKG